MDRERTGFFTTPPGLASELARRVAARWSSCVPAVLDPACGDGILLEAAWHIGKERGLTAARLFGIEIDPDLARAARERLGRLIGGTQGELAARNVIDADALGLDRAWPRGTSVVANPPWVSFSGRRAAPRAPGSRLGRGAGWPSLHGAFLERIARHVASERTHAAVLLPASVCDGTSYAPLRALVSGLVNLAGDPLELGEDAFHGVVEPAVLVELAPEPAGEGPTTAAWGPAVDGPGPARLAQLPRLPPESFGDPGVHTGNAARELIVREGGKGLPGIREGRDLQAFWLGPPRLRLNVGLRRTPELRFRVKDLEHYREVPVLVRQTADRPVAALHTGPTYFRNSLLACRPPAGLDPAFLVAVLNSQVAAGWHRASFRDARQRTFPQVKVAHLRSLPVPFTHRDRAPRLHDRVVRLVRAMAMRPHPTRDEAAEVEALVAEAYEL